MNPTPSTLLFCPGHRRDRYDKVWRAGVPGIVIDLEDGVGAADKSAARDAALGWLATVAAADDPCGDDPAHRQASDPATARVRPLPCLRVNPLRSALGLDDVHAFLHAERLPRHGWLLVPKVEEPAELQWLWAHVARRAPHWRLCGLVESGRGLQALPRIAASPGLAALGFGGADLMAELGLGDGHEPLHYPRARFVVDASGHGLHLMDVPHLELDAPEALHAECLRVRALGFGGKFAIHPRQVPVIQAAFAPDGAQLLAARRIVDAHEAAGGQAVQVDARMVDEPLYRRALATLAAARP